MAKTHPSSSSFKMSSLDAEDVQSSNDEFHDAMEAVEEEGVEMAADIPVDPAEMVAGATGRDDSSAIAAVNTDEFKGKSDPVKQEPEILCTLSESAGMLLKVTREFEMRRADAGFISRRAYYPWYFSL